MSSGNHSDMEVTQAQSDRGPHLDPSAAATLAAFSQHSADAIGSNPISSFPKLDGYEVQEAVGEGGMGMVWRAVQLATKRQVALKLMSTASLGSERARLRFEREVELSAKLEHPHIARVYDSGIRHGVFFYAMELVEGVPLDQFLSRPGVSRRDLVELIQSICLAVQHAHAKGIIHRDLKPANILVDKAGQPRVLDFGLAKAIQGDGSNAAISIDGEMAGTPAYMSPEQASGRLEKLDTRSDVYTLGVILFRLLCGQFPHEVTGTYLDVMRRIAELEPRRLRAIDPSLDADLESICGKALEQTPERRYDSAGALAADLGHYLAGDPVQARPATLSYFLQKRIRKHKLGFAAAAILLCSAVGGIAFYVASIRTEQSRTEAARHLADQRADEARRHEAAAQTARDLAQAQTEKARQSLYGSQISLAHQFFQNGEPQRAQNLLSQLPHDLRNFEWYYLQHVSDLHAAPFGSLRADQKLGAVAFSPDSRKIAGPFDQFGGYMLGMWDSVTGALLFTSPQQKPRPYALAFDPIGHFVAGLSDDDMLRVWEAAPGMRLRFAVLVKANDGTGHTNLACSADGHTIATGTNGTEVALWDADTGKPLTRLKGQKGRAQALAFSPDGKSLAVGDFTDRLTVWNLEHAEPLYVVEGLVGRGGFGVASLLWSADGQRLIAGQNGPIQLLDARTGNQQFSYHAHSSLTSRLSCSDDGKWIASSSPDGTGALFDAGGRRLVQRVSGILSISPDGNYAVRYGTATPVVWRIASQPFQVSQEAASAISIDASGGFVAHTKLSEEPTIQLRQASSGLLVRELKGHSNSVLALAFDRSGSRLASTSTNEVTVWDSRSGGPVFSTRRASGRMVQVAMTPDGSVVAAGSAGGTLQAWDVASGKLLYTRELATSGSSTGHEIKTLKFAPDGKMFAVGLASSRTIYLLDPLTGQDLRLVQPSRNPAEAAAWSATGSLLASGDSSGLVQVGPAPQWLGRSLGTLLEPVADLAFSPDNQRLATLGRSGQVRISDVASGQTVLDLNTQSAVGNAWHVNWAADGRKLYVNGATVVTLDGGTSSIAPDLAVPLAQSVRLRTDVVQGQWEWNRDKSITAQGHHDYERLCLGICTDGSYRLHSEFTRTRAGQRRTVGFHLPIGTGRALLCLDHDLRKLAGLDQINGKGVESGSANGSQTPCELVNDKRYSLDVVVQVHDDQADVEARLDGQPLIHWNGPQSALKPYPNWDIPQAQTFGLATGDCDVTFHAVNITALDKQMRWLRQSPPNAPEGYTKDDSQRPIDLMPLLDVPGIAGETRRSLVMKFSDEAARIATADVVPLNGYQAHGTVTLDDTRASTVLCLPFKTWQVSLLLNGNVGGRRCCGIGRLAVGDIGSEAHPATMWTALEAGRKYAVDVKVTPIGDESIDIDATLDGQPLVHWMGPRDALKPRVDKHTLEGRIVVVARDGGFQWDELTLTPDEEGAWVASRPTTQPTQP